MDGLQLATLSGGLVASGFVLLAARFLPTHPDLADAINRVSSPRSRPAGFIDRASSTKERLGSWGLRVLPPGLWARTPYRELALLRISIPRFYGEKLMFAALGLATPLVVTTILTVSGVTLPIQIPALASLALAVLMFFVPNYNARDDAKRARVDFIRALGAYIDLVALERNNGIGHRQAMEGAAEVGDSWVFTRLLEELTRSRWSGTPPWDALHTLAEELGLPELDDFADIMRLSGEEGAGVYVTLRARSAAIRAALLNDELARANAVGERMSMPTALLGVIFMALLVAPSLLRMFTNS